MNYSKQLLASVPLNKRTEKLCRKYLEKDIVNLFDVPLRVKRKIITPEKAIELIKESFTCISCIPSRTLNSIIDQIWELRDQLYLFDITLFLQNCPKKAFTQQFCRAVIHKFPHSGVLEYIPNSAKTKKFCQYALSHNRKLIKELPEEKIYKNVFYTIEKKDPISRFTPSEGIKKNILVPQTFV